MNILIPHTWLLEHLETTVSPKELQRLVSLSGPSVERIYDRLGDSVYDVEITTNRVDSMSIRGFAREAAVILSQTDKSSKLKPLGRSLDTTQSAITAQTKLPLPKIFDNPKLNFRTLCVVLSNIERTPTPEWMATRLQQTEMNVHDAAIDITNYITHELGHPCHAFDYDKLMATGGEIHIIEAQAGETFVTLDGTSFTTKGGEVVFKNAEGTIIDLPSIKGTKNTSVDESTKTIMLLMESIRPDKVRFASMTHAIRTTAAQLLEKNLDPHLATETLALGIELYQSICHAKQASEIHDSFLTGQVQAKQETVTLHSQEITRYLGISLPSEHVVSILEQLGCSVEVEQSESRSPHYVLHVTPPTFRSDLHIPADIVEEIARIYGYHNLPSALMDTAIPTTYQENTNFELEHKLKTFLALVGWQETYNYSLVSQELAAQSGMLPVDHLAVANPLTEDMVYLRKTLVPSLVQMVKTNPMHRPLSVFEFATVYLESGAEGKGLEVAKSADQKITAVPYQPLRIGLVSTQSYEHLKGALEALLSQVYVDTLSVVTDNKPMPGYRQSAQLYVVNGVTKGTTQHTHLGWIGIEADSGFAAAELDWVSLLSVAKQNPTYQPLPKTSIVSEDITFTLPEKTEVGPLITAIKQLHPVIKAVEFTGKYKQNVSLRLTFHNPESNLSSLDIEPIRKQIVDWVERQASGSLVGTLK